MLYEEFAHSPVWYFFVLTNFLLSGEQGESIATDSKAGEEVREQKNPLRGGNPNLNRSKLLQGLSLNNHKRWETQGTLHTGVNQHNSGKNRT